MGARLWIVVANRDGAVIADGSGQIVGRALVPALPERRVPLAEVSARARLATGAMAVRLRSWLMAEAAAGAFARLAVLAPPEVLAELRFRLEDGLSDRLIACLEAEVAPEDTKAAVALLAEHMAEVAA